MHRARHCSAAAAAETAGAGAAVTLVCAAAEPAAAAIASTIIATSLIRIMGCNITARRASGNHRRSCRDHLGSHFTVADT